MTDIEKVREQAGDWPVVVARNYSQFLDVCKVLDFRPHRATNAANVHALEGARPTSVIFTPGWVEHPNSVQIGRALDRLTVSRRPVMVYLTEDDLR